MNSPAMHTISHIQFYAVVAVVIGILTQTFEALGQNNAEDLYKNKSLVFPSNIRHLVVFIPNEAHESLTQPEDQLPLIDQAFLPQNAIVSSGTMVTWFNGDHGHDHKVTLTDTSPNSTLFESGWYGYNETSGAIVLNDIGTYSYYEANVCQNLQDPQSCWFAMKGNIAVMPKANLDGSASEFSSDNNTDSTSAINNGLLVTLDTPDIAGVLMVPSQNIENYVQYLTSKGFTVDSTYNFKSIRPGGQPEAGEMQTLLVWTTSGINLDEVISGIQELVPTLPYN